MDRMLTRKLLTLTIVMLTLTSVAYADCYIGGNIAAEPATDPMYPSWKYTATINWDTGTQYALSHLDMVLDAANGTCTCADLAQFLVYEGISGYSDGVPMSCQVEYETFLECNGDPSIPGDEGIIFKFEPVAAGCEPGTTGTATFTFYSDLPPAPIDEEILLLYDKFGQHACSGFLSGLFPGFACDPVSSESTNWDAMKGLFR